MSVNLPQKHGGKNDDFSLKQHSFRGGLMMKLQKRLRHGGCGELTELRGFIFPTDNAL